MTQFTIDSKRYRAVPFVATVMNAIRPHLAPGAESEVTERLFAMFADERTELTTTDAGRPAWCLENPVKAFDERVAAMRRMLAHRPR